MKHFHRFLPLTLVLAGCMPVASGTLRIPPWQVLQQNVQVKDTGLNVQLTVQLSNPNPFDLALTDIQGDWILDGKISHSLQLGAVQLPAGGTANVQVNTQAPLPASWNPAKTHTYRFDGSYRLQGNGSGGAIQQYTVFQGAFR